MPQCHSTHVSFQPRSQLKAYKQHFNATFNLIQLRCSAYMFQALETFRMTFLRMRGKCKIINVQRNDKASMV